METPAPGESHRPWRRLPLPRAAPPSAAGSGHQPEAHARLREQASVAVIGVTELLAQLAGVDPEVVRLRAVARTPHLLQDRTVGEHASRVAGQQGEEVELLAGEVHRPA